MATFFIQNSLHGINIIAKMFWGFSGAALCNNFNYMEKTQRTIGKKDQTGQ